MTMDASFYKDFNIDGLQYHYYYHPPKSSDVPTLLFLHGFPSNSDHWEHQVAYFSGKGYGVIAPDMLGYGGTSKPVDHKAFVVTTLATHCMGILDAEGIQKALVVSHDW
jgi:soluble epoxide hydrolase / lipid-phosphate phosphatase